MVDQVYYWQDRPIESLTHAELCGVVAKLVQERTRDRAIFRNKQRRLVRPDEVK